MRLKNINWPVWLGFFLTLVAFLSYFLVFVKFPITRDFPWVNLLLFGAAAVLLFVGIRRAFSSDRPRPLLSKIAGGALAILSAAVLGLFIFAVFIEARKLPTSLGAPKIGQTSPEFTLPDINRKPTSLAELTSTPINGKTPKGALLIFYRGYW